MNTTHWDLTIDDVTQVFKTTFGSLNARQLNWKPDANTWSIGQNIDHLIVINSTYFSVIEAVRNGTHRLPWVARWPFMVSFMGRTVLSAVQPDRKRKMKTFPLWEPTRSDVPADIVDRFSRHQEDLKTLIRSASDLISRGTIISSPANRNIVYSLATAFDVITAHEQRHFEQAKDILHSMEQRSEREIIKRHL